MSRHPDARYLEVRLEGIELLRGGQRVLQGIEWTLRPGERWILAGGNGAGKTQLLKLIAGTVWPTPHAGSARRYRWRGESFATPYEVKEEIGYVGPERQDRYEHYAWDHRVDEVVGTGLHRTDIPLDPLTPAAREVIGRALGRLGIAHLAARRFLSLSYGERRLTLLARALAAAPRLLLLDELLSGLDPVNHARAVRWLEGSTRSRLPWVLATHRLGDVPRGATHALILERGEIRYRGPLRTAPLSSILRSVCIARTAPAARARRHSGASLRPLVRVRHGDVFLGGRRVLEDLNLEIRPGECWVLHGPNGAGKTTLLRTLYGDHGVASGGAIERAGVGAGVPLETFKRRVGFVAPHLQTDHPRHLTVVEVVQSGLRASIGLNTRCGLRERRKSRRALAAFGLLKLAARPIGELSYGQFRRVLFARAWVGDPRLLLLDEAFSGLDASTRDELLLRTARLAAGGGAIVVCAHHREDWPDCADHELELASGRIRYCGPLRAQP